MGWVHPMSGPDLSEAPDSLDAPDTASPDWPRMLEKYGRLVYSVPRRFGLGPEDCDDVYQSTWLTAVSRPNPPFDDEGGVAVRWLASIAAWETRNLIRRRKLPLREQEVLEGVEDDAETLPDRLEEIVEEHALVEAALAALPARDREIVRALFLGDAPLSYAEIAERAGIAVGSVGPLRLRAIERLRSELLRRGFDGGRSP